VQSQRDCELFTGEDFYSEHRATRASARFLIDLTTEVAGSEEESDERSLKCVAKR